MAIALGGRPAGLVFEGDRRFDVVVRLADATRDDFDQLGALPIVLENGVTVPLRTLADFQVVDGLAEVRREQGRRLVIVSANVRERDLGSFVEEAQEGVAAQVDLPPASFIEWGGQYQNLQAAQARLAIVVPICFRRCPAPAVHGAWWLGSGPGGVQRHPDGPGGRCICSRLERHALLGIGGGRLHRPVGCGGAQRSRHDDCDPAAARKRHGAR